MSPSGEIILLLYYIVINLVQEREGIIDSNGKMIIPAIYYKINQLNDHLFEAQTCDIDYYYEA
jgi:hypothetical protein